EPVSSETIDPVGPYLAATTTLFPPLFLLLILGAGFSEVALLGRRLTDHEREWRSRVGAYVLMVAFAWLVFFGVTLWLPRLWPVFAPELRVKLKIGTILGWLATSVATRLATRGAPAKPGGKWRGAGVAFCPPPVFSRRGGRPSGL